MFFSGVVCLTEFFLVFFRFFNLNVCLFVCLFACLFVCLLACLLACFFMVLNLDDASKHDFLGENQSYEPTVRQRLPRCHVPKASVFVDMNGRCCTSC